MTRRTSLVNAGDGIADPDETSVYRVWSEESQVALVVEWEGNGYDGRDCWIQAGKGSFSDLDGAV